MFDWREHKALPKIVGEPPRNFLRFNLIVKDAYVHTMLINMNDGAGAIPSRDFRP